MQDEARILIVEDLPSDARLNEREIRKVLPDCQFQRVETREAYIDALEQFKPHLIISDFKLPRFDGLSALQIARDRIPNVPFIVVTGSMNEDTAVDCMKAGAWDYVIKEHIRRLGPAILTALDNQQVRERRLDAEEALRESEERFRRAVVNAPFPTILHAGDGRILLINDAWTAQSGYQPDELPNLEVWAEKAYGDRKQGILRGIQALHSLQERQDEGEFTIHTKSGADRIWHFSSSPLGHLPDGDTIVMSMAIDITERRRNEEEKARLEEQLRQAQKMESIGRLAGGVAHDFNNLLTVINGYSELTMGSLMEDDPLWLYINEIKKAGGRAAELTQQLLAFSRKQLIQPKPVALNDVITRMTRMIERLTGSDVQLITDFDPSLAQILADEGQLNQVLMNLVVNAKDAMPDGGTLTLTTRNVQLDGTPAAGRSDLPAGGYVLLEVSDTGVGMNEETIRLIFEPFFTTKGEGKGTGLGLSTLYGIVRQLGGGIHVASIPGGGATFSIYFPQLHGDALTVTPQALPDTELHGSETILVVEDQEEVRSFVVAVLKNYGYRVLEAQQAGDALLITERHFGTIHLMLTDMIMPRMSGADLANRLRPLRPDMRILLMSGFSGDVDPLVRSLQGTSGYLQKPFTPRALAAKIREALAAPI